MTSTVEEMLRDRRIFSYRRLASVPVHENGEPLVRMQTEHGMGVMTADLKFPWIRSGARGRLLAAGRQLRQIDTRHSLHVLYAYRSLAVQRAGFERQRKLLAATHPNLGDDELDEKAHLFSAVPAVAGHPTGGAVDVTILTDGAQADMGGDYGDFTSATLHTFSDGLTDGQRGNRMLLRQVMVGAGFAPFNGEWWHFSYGDREWAAMWGEAAAIYSQFEAPAG